MDSLVATRVLFGGEAPAEVAALLEQAMQAHADGSRAEDLLWQAQRQSPGALPVYFSLYKYYFYKGDLEQAELAARMALCAAARLAGFDADWQRLAVEVADWADHAAPAHFYMFSLKALAFIRLRRGDTVEAQELLAKLAELDPQDRVGASVIRSLCVEAV
jgi:tetratricopeptide (TPR) repeat protein